MQTRYRVRKDNRCGVCSAITGGPEQQRAMQLHLPAANWLSSSGLFQTGKKHIMPATVTRASVEEASQTQQRWIIKKKTNKRNKDDNNNKVLVFSSTCKHLTASLDRATGENKWSRGLLDLSLIAWEHSKFHYLGHLSPMHLLFSPFLLSSFLFAHLRCNT